MSETPAKNAKQPAIVQKLLLRTSLLLLIIAGLVLGFQWLKGTGGDIDLPANADTKGMILAIQQTDNGTQVVMIKPDGTLVPSPDYKTGASDREPVWRPDGNRAFFISDRKDGEYNVFRWNPASDRVEARSTGKTAKSNLAFAEPTAAGANETGILTAGGRVQEFHPKEGALRQILPPTGKDIPDKSEESQGQMDMVYQRFGSSFKSARWSTNKRFIIAVMRRDEGEILLIQDTEPMEDPVTKQVALPPPMPIVAAERIEFDVCPTTGEVVFVVQNFQYLSSSQIPPEMIKNGVATRPFTHAVGIAYPGKPLEDSQKPIMISPDDKLAFGKPAISPDGSTVLLTTGNYSGGIYHATSLVSVPKAPEGGKSGTRIMDGEIDDVGWGPNSQVLIFTKREGGKRAVFTMNRDGSDLKNLTGTKGNFFSPRLSPQQ